MPIRAVVLTCLAALLLVGCRETVASAPPPADPPEPKLHRIAHGYEAQWTADGRIVYVDSRDGDVWSIRPDGKRARRLVRMKADVGLLLAPDRTRMLLLRSDKNLVAGTDGRRVRPIAAVSQSSTARWSDDGSTLTFQRDREGQGSIWSVPARGGPPERLFREFGGGVLAWAPDGRMVVRAFQAREGGSFQATLLVVPDEEPRELPSLIAARFGPEGTVEGIETQGTLVQLAENGEVLRRFPGERIGALPDYTADGTLMVYEQAQRLWLAFADWTAPRMLADAPCYGPAFSPDETRVACSLITKEHGRTQRHVAVIAVPPDLQLQQP